MFGGRMFRSQASFRVWLEAHHHSANELVVRCFKVAYGDRGLTYRQALDEALCFGWIDGVRHGRDEFSFTVRFTPRTARSAWSRVNRERAKELQALGLLRPAGLEALRRGRRPAHSYESTPRRLSRALRSRLRANQRAWSFFTRQPEWYQRVSADWVMSSRRPETRERRFALLLTCSAADEPVPPLERAPARVGARDGVGGHGANHVE